MLMMFQVAEALKFIGEERFVHRDIAARNCLGESTHDILIGSEKTTLMAHVVFL